MKRLFGSLILALWIAVQLAACGGGGGGGGGGNAPGAGAEKYVTNGTVVAIAVGADGITYIGGGFTLVGPMTGSGVPIDAATGTKLPTFPKVTGTIFAVAPDGSGGWYIGGSFTYVGGLARSNISHILSNGTVDPSWNPNPNSYVFALAVSGSTVYAGGGFTSIGGHKRKYIAALDATGVPTSWNPSPNYEVRALAVSGSTVYAGGEFTSIASGGTTTTRNYLAAIDATTGHATSWNPNPNYGVSALAVSGSTVYAGGVFTSIASGATTTTTRNNLAAIDATTGYATSWDPSPNTDVNAFFIGVNALAVSGSTVYAGGYFTSIASGATTTTTRNHLAAIDATTGYATSWKPNPNNPVFALAVSGSTVYAGGMFSSIASGATTTTTRNGLAAIDATTGYATSWDPNPNYGVVNALAVSGSTVYAGGGFTSIGGQKRNYIAALDATGVPTSWNPNANSYVSALAVSGSTVYAGGEFTSIASGATTTTTRRNLAAIDATTGYATSWNPNPNSRVNALAVSGSTVYAGGYFTSIASAATTTTARNGLAAIDAATGYATSWDPNPNYGLVNALAVSGSTVYAGGWFSSIASGATTTTRNNLAAIDATTGYATSWAPNPNNPVSALAVSGSTVYAGGYFTSIASGGTTTTRNYLAAIDATTGYATSWNPNPNYYVNALAVSGSTVYAGGGFTSIASGATTTTTRRNLAAIDSTTGYATSWNPNPNYDVYALAVSGSTVYVGGSFASVGTDPISHFAILSQ